MKPGWGRQAENAGLRCSKTNRQTRWGAEYEAAGLLTQSLLDHRALAYFFRMSRMPRIEAQPRRHVQNGEQLALAHRAVAESRQLHIVRFPRYGVFEAEALHPTEARRLQPAQLECRAVARQHAFEHRHDLIGLHGRLEAEALQFL